MIPPPRARSLLTAAAACGLVPFAAAGAALAAWAWRGDPDILWAGLRPVLAGVPATAAGALALIGFIVPNLRHPAWVLDWRPRCRAVAALLCLGYPAVGAYAWAIPRLQRAVKVVVENRSAASLTDLSLWDGARRPRRLGDLEPGESLSVLFFPEGSGELRLSVNATTRETQCVILERIDPERGARREAVIGSDLGCSVSG